MPTLGAKNAPKVGHPELWLFYAVTLCGLRTKVLEAVPHSGGEDGIEIHVAEVVLVSRREGREALHEAWVVPVLSAVEWMHDIKPSCSGRDDSSGVVHFSVTHSMMGTKMRHGQARNGCARSPEPSSFWRSSSRLFV